jgi:hypothetical protein
MIFIAEKRFTVAEDALNLIDTHPHINALALHVVILFDQQLKITILVA